MLRKIIIMWYCCSFVANSVSYFMLGEKFFYFMKTIPGIVSFTLFLISCLMFCIFILTGWGSKKDKE